jgi:hypothetical protein
LKGGHRSPLPGGSIHPSTPLRACRSRPAERLSHRPIRRQPAAISRPFPRNMEPHRVGFENRQDLRCFLEAGAISRIIDVFFALILRVDPPCDGYPPRRGGWATYARGGEFAVRKGSLNTPARHLSAGGALRITASSSHPSTRHRYASRQVLLGPVEEAGDRGLERLGILTPP